MSEEVKFSTTLNTWALPSDCTVKISVRDESWGFRLKKIGSTSFFSVHIANPVMKIIEEHASQWKFLGIEHYEPNNSYSTNFSFYLGFRELVKFLEILETQNNFYDFEGGEQFKEIKEIKESS